MTSAQTPATGAFALGSLGLREPAGQPGTDISLPMPMGLSGAHASPVAMTSFEDALAEAERRGLDQEHLKTARWAVRLAARATGAAAAKLPVSPPALRPILESVVPRRVGISDRRWAKAKTELARLARSVGAIPAKEELGQGLSPAWTRFVESIRGGRHHTARRACLTPFAMFCTAQGTEPAGVAPEQLDAYGRWQSDASYVLGIGRLLASIRRAFNMAAGAVPELGAGRLIAAADPRVKAKPVGAFPPAFGAALEVYLDSLLNPDPLDPRAGRPLSPVTVRGRRQLVLDAASVLVAHDTPIEAFTSLAPLTSSGAARIILLDIYRRRGNRWTPYAKNTVATLIDIARRVVGLDEPELAKLRELNRMVRSPRQGMGLRSRNRLAQFDDDRALARLFELPEKLYGEAQARLRTGSKIRGAQSHEMGLALHLTLHQPLRVANLCRLDVERHFQRDGRGRISGLLIPAAETKGGVEIRTALPRELAAALERHLRDFRPHLLGPTPTTSLFPGGHGRPTRDPQVLARRISQTVRRWIGADYNTHLARHLAATLLLDADPGNGPVAQRLLGHSSLKVTEQVYAAQRTRSAQAIYSQLIDEKVSSLRRHGSSAGRPAAGHRINPSRRTR